MFTQETQSAPHQADTLLRPQFQPVDGAAGQTYPAGKAAPFTPLGLAASLRGGPSGP